MSDNHLFVPILAVIIFTFILGSFSGVGVENNRLYQKCMTDNGTMIHDDAVTKCKAITK